PRFQLLAHLCGVGVFDLLANLKRRFSTSDGLRAITEFVQCEGRIPQRISFASAVTDLTSDGKMLLIELNRAPGLAQRIVGIAQVAERSAFAYAVTDLTSDGEMLLIELNRAPGLAQGIVGNAQVAERIAFTYAVTELTSDGEMLLIELNRAPGL